MVLTTSLFDKPEFNNIILNGLVMDGHSKKIPKRLKNDPYTNIVINQYINDALHMYLIKPPIVRA